MCFICLLHKIIKSFTTKSGIIHMQNKNKCCSSLNQEAQISVVMVVLKSSKYNYMTDNEHIIISTSINIER